MFLWEIWQLGLGKWCWKWGCGVNEMEKHDKVSRYRRRLGVEDEGECVRKMTEDCAK